MLQRSHQRRGDSMTWKHYHKENPSPVDRIRELEAEVSRLTQERDEARALAELAIDTLRRAHSTPVSVEKDGK